MNIRAINIENWKKFTDPIEINLEKGLNVLYGPNECGKSTLIESIITTFYTKHTSASQSIKSLKPWGTSLKSRASITFLQNGQEYRINKSFQEKKCILERKYNENWQKIAEGDEADREVIKLVGGKFPSRGDTKPEFWGLGQMLWMVQGKPIISDNLNDETLSLLQTMVSATVESSKEKEILNKIKTQYLELFTEKKKDIRAKSRLYGIKEEIKSIEKDLHDSQISKNRKDELISQIQNKELILQKNQRDLIEAKKEKEKINKEVEEAQEHKKDREDLENKIQRIQNEYDALNDKINEIKTNIKDINLINEDNLKTKLEIQPLEQEKQELSKNIDEQVKKLQDLNTKINEITTTKNMVGVAHTTVMDEQTLETIKERFKEIKGLYDDLKTVEEEFVSIIAPSSEELQKIEKLNQKIHDAQIQLKAIGLNIKALAKPFISGEIFLDGDKTNLRLDKDEKALWTANQSFKIDIDNVGEFEVSSGSQDVKAINEELGQMQNEYHKLTESFKTQNIEDLKNANFKKESSKKEIERIEIEINKKSDKTLDELENEIIVLEKKINDNWNKIPDEYEFKESSDTNKSSLRDELSNKLKNLEAEVIKLTEERDTLNNKIESDRKNAFEMDRNITSLETELFGQNKRVEEIQKRLNKLEDDGLTSDERENNLNNISYELEQKNRALNVYQDEMEEREEKPFTVFQGLKNKVDRLEQDIHSQEISKAGMDSELQVLISQSTNINELEERLFQLQRKEKDLQIEASALKLLFELTSFYRETTIGELSEPIHKKVTHDLEKLLGPKYTLNFDKEMKPESINVYGEDAPIDILSFGTQEQIWYIFRLALGSILSKDEPQLVVLDDPLVNTDPIRMHHALEILEENAKTMQIVVVTCDVDKYDTLADANFISI